MKRIYINSRQAEESRIIVAEDGQLVGFEQNTVGSENKKGDIYKGVVTRVEESLDAVFVNYGEDKDGFLPVKYIAPNLPGASGEDGKLAEGDSILVQIKKDHVSGKGAGLTTFITLAGSYLVLRPNQPSRTLMSKNIDGKSRHQNAMALKALALPDGMGAILRSAGQDRSVEELRWDLESYLLKLWDAITTVATEHKGPILIYRENNFLLRAVRDYFKPETDEIYCDNLEDCNELKGFLSLLMANGADKVQYHGGEEPLVPADVEAQIDEVYERKVKTRSGAVLVFDSTEALVAIDVNSAQIRGANGNIEQTALQTNLEAADVIARHLRLRDLAGLIVVDFIDMVDEKNCAKLSHTFSALLQQDRARVQWSPLSRFCMMEISRQRLSRSVEATQTLLCPTCAGTGRQWKVESFSLRLLRRLQEVAQRSSGSLLVRAPAETAFYLLNEKRAELHRIEDTSNCEIVIVPMKNMHPPDFSIRNFGDGKITEAHKQTHEDDASATSERMRLQERQRAPQKPLIKTVMPEKRAPQNDQPGWAAKIISMVGGLFSNSGKPPPRQKPHAKESHAGGSRSGNGSGNSKRRRKPLPERKSRPYAEAATQTRETGANGQPSKRRRHAGRRKNTADNTQPSPQQPAADNNIAPAPAAVKADEPPKTAAIKSAEQKVGGQDDITPRGGNDISRTISTAANPHQESAPPIAKTDSPPPKAAETTWFEPEMNDNTDTAAGGGAKPKADHNLLTSAAAGLSPLEESPKAQTSPPPWPPLTDGKPLQMIETAAAATPPTKMVMAKKELAASEAPISPTSIPSSPMKQVEVIGTAESAGGDKSA